jgi:hypothetical protein
MTGGIEESRPPLRPGDNQCLAPNLLPPQCGPGRRELGSIWRKCVSTHLPGHLCKWSTQIHLTACGQLGTSIGHLFRLIDLFDSAGPEGTWRTFELRAVDERGNRMRLSTDATPEGPSSPEIGCQSVYLCCVRKSQIDSIAKGREGTSQTARSLRQVTERCSFESPLQTIAPAARTPESSRPEP